jgi:Putative abortive phage resistance protein AbiGi, antitoxin
MGQSIREVLHRRTDLSTFVVHLTRATPERTARQALDSIIRERRLRASTPMGFGKANDDPSDSEKQSQRVVCFSETPLEHIHSLVADIEKRQIKLAPYGLALTKLVARSKGVNPVWYVDQTMGRNWELSQAVNELVAEAQAAGNFHDRPIAKIAPFVETMGTWHDTQKEFWWEREWRHTGDLYLHGTGIIWLCPEEEIESLLDHEGNPVHPVIDPRWGLEQIIAHLAGFPGGDVTPFGAH